MRAAGTDGRCGLLEFLVAGGVEGVPASEVRRLAFYQEGIRFGRAGKQPLLDSQQTRRHQGIKQRGQPRRLYAQFSGKLRGAHRPGTKRCEQIQLHACDHRKCRIGSRTKLLNGLRLQYRGRHSFPSKITEFFI
ncbi:MAG: hypothetical protein P4L94_05825 [Telmatospirillum sp.]|nr:hypothetical protein [Telmatospirillum sp.]MDR3436127.1 hypothetical protein [Telmatospirillum sp.]